MKRTICIIAGTAALYVGFMALVWDICTHQAERNTENLLDYAMKDFRDASNGAIDTMMTQICEEMVRHFGSPQERSFEEMQRLAYLADVDEINVVDKTGLIIASNLKSELGYNMSSHPDAAAFLVLTNGVTRIFSPPFRASATTPDKFYKYTGVAFPEGNGYVQVGLSEKHLTRMYPIILGHIFDEWRVGKKGFFLCSDLRDGVLVSKPPNHRDAPRNLLDTGYDSRYVPNDPGATFRQRLFGEECDCRTFTFATHRIVAAVPLGEFYTWRSIVFSVIAAALFAVMGGFAFFINRVASDSDRLKLFYATEEARRAKDMEIAKTIQNAALPGELPDCPHFAIHAFMTPARLVGGDFYDYFALGPTLVAFLVADVSGKGITGALYMMTAKTLIKDMLLATRDPALAVSRVNDELCANNPANMFLTAWVGVYNLETGVVTYVNAGHNPPALLRSASEIAPEPLTERSGPVLAFMPGIKYKPRQVKLAPGDAICLYTDGVTEAMDKKGELFGDDRLDATLRTTPSLLPDAVCLHVKMAVMAFSEGTPQSDDITVLTFLCKSIVQRKVRTFPVSQAALASAMEFLDETLVGEAQCKKDVQGAFDIILDEIVSNIVKFSRASGFELDIEIIEEPRGVNLVFVDDGVPYNPLAHVDPDTTLSADERPIGGLGILMVKKLSDSVSYRREHNRNFLTVFKKI